MAVKHQNGNISYDFGLNKINEVELKRGTCLSY